MVGPTGNSQLPVLRDHIEPELALLLLLGLSALCRDGPCSAERAGSWSSKAMMIFDGVHYEMGAISLADGHSNISQHVNLCGWPGAIIFHQNMENDSARVGRAGNHTEDGSHPHNVSPIRRLPLRYKVTFFAAILAIFVALVSNAIRLVYARKAEAILPYLLLGVSGIFAAVIVGLPLIFGVSG